MIALYWFVLALIALAIEAFSQQLVLLFVGLAALIAGGMAELGLALRARQGCTRPSSDLARPSARCWPADSSRW